MITDSRAGSEPLPYRAVSVVCTLLAKLLRTSNTSSLLKTETNKVMMFPSTNTYYSEPAIPLLASSLLSQSSSSKTGSKAPQAKSSSRLPHRDTNRYGPGSWDLRWDLENSIQCSNETVLRSGSVIGLSKLRNRTDNTTRGDDSVGQLARYILSKHLLKNPRLRGLSTTGGEEPNTFIIHPPNFGPFAPESLLSSLLSITHSQHHPGLGYEHPLSREQAIRHLDSVQLLPGFDFPTTAQSIGKISDTLQGIQTQQQQHQQRQQRQRQWQRQQQDQQNPLPDSDSDSHPRPILLVITGLDSLAEGVVRASNTVRATAMLTTILRTLTRLTRTYASLLSVLLVNTGGVGSTTTTNITASTGSSAYNNSSVKSSMATRLGGEEQDNYYQTRYDGDNDSSGGDGGSVQSVFGAPSGPGPGMGSSLFPSLLMKTLDQGVDTHLLLSTVRRSQIVEVIKDRVGDGTGKWCVWGLFP